MAQYEVLQGCYLPHRGMLRHFKEGDLVDLNSDDLADIPGLENYVQLAKSTRITIFGGRAKVTKSDIRSSDLSALPKADFSGPG